MRGSEGKDVISEVVCVYGRVSHNTRLFFFKGTGKLYDGLSACSFAVVCSNHVGFRVSLVWFGLK